MENKKISLQRRVGASVMGGIAILLTVTVLHPAPIHGGLAPLCGGIVGFYVYRHVRDE